MAPHGTLAHVKYLQNKIKRLQNKVRILSQSRQCASCRSVSLPPTNDSPPLEAPERNAISDSNGFQTSEALEAATRVSNVLSTAAAAGDDTFSGANNLSTLATDEDNTTGLEIIEYRPEAKGRSLSANSPWLGYADELLDKIQFIRTSGTLNYTRGFCESRIREILGGVSIRNTSTSLSPLLEGPWKELRNFARITNGTGDLVESVSNVHAFQQLIFVSACVVLKVDGVEDSLIDDAIRLCTSKPKPSKSRALKSKALKEKDVLRFLKCPLWICKQINKWGELATECLFHSESNEN